MSDNASSRLTDVARFRPRARHFENVLSAIEGLDCHEGGRCRELQVMRQLAMDYLMHLSMWPRAGVPFMRGFRLARLEITTLS